MIILGYDNDEYFDYLNPDDGKSYRLKLKAYFTGLKPQYWDGSGMKFDNEARLFYGTLPNTKTFATVKGSGLYIDAPRYNAPDTADYLNLIFTEDQNSHLSNINSGEGETIEFKETYNWDVRENRWNNDLKEEVTKEICSFLNRDGGKVYIGVDDDGKVIGLERDLQKFINFDGIQKDISQKIQNDVGGAGSNAQITIIEIKNINLCVIDVPKSTVPVFFKNSDFIVRTGTRSPKFTAKQTFDYIFSHFNLKSENVELEKLLKKREIPTGVDPNDERFDILNKILKNFSIIYYSEGYNPTVSQTMFGIIEQLCKFNPIFQSQYLNSSNTVAHNKIIRKFFHMNIYSFKEKLKKQEIQIEKIQRSFFILAGDLALEFWNECNKRKFEKSNLLDKIRQDYEHTLSKTTYFLGESYSEDRFKEALKILEEEFGLIKTSEPYEGSDSKAEWEIIDLDGLYRFVKWKSIEFLLRQIIISEYIKYSDRNRV